MKPIPILLFMFVLFMSTCKKLYDNKRSALINYHFLFTGTPSGHCCLFFLLISFWFQSTNDHPHLAVTVNSVFCVCVYKINSTLYFSFKPVWTVFVVCTGTTLPSNTHKQGRRCLVSCERIFFIHKIWDIVILECLIMLVWWRRKHNGLDMSNTFRSIYTLF